MDFTRLAAACALALSGTTATLANDPAPDYEVHQTIELAKGVCANPNMDDGARAEMISRSLEDAVECMGSEWVYGGAPLITPAALGRFEVDADVSANRIRVTDREGQMRVILTSPGVRGAATETLTGDFKGPFRLEGRDYVVQNTDVDFTGAPMPFATFYNPNGKTGETGYAIHGTTAVKQLGRPASHGCLRVLTSEAKFINDSIREANDASVTIRVHGRIANSVFNTPAVRPRPQPQVRPQFEYPDDYRVPTPRRAPPARDEDDDGISWPF